MSTSDLHFDLVIIGTGSGNTILDERFESWSVAIVERSVFGGTCINHGCVPTKMFVHPADLVEEAKGAARFGIDATVDAVRWRDIRDRVFGRIDPISIDGERYRNSQPNVTVVRGDAHFVAPRTLTVVDGDRSTTLTADRFVIAAGARPTVPDIEGIDNVGYETSDTIMRLDDVPERLVVLGGGFIAAELSHVFGSFGSDVTIVTRGDLMLSQHDHEVATAFTAIQAERFTLHRNATITSAKRVGDWVELTMADGSPLIADTILLATGRRPNSDQLGLDAAGIECHPDGRIVTDDTLRATAAGVWALGDIRAHEMLKHVANHEADVIRHNLLHPDDPHRIHEDVTPHAVFGRPQIAAVGLTEEEAAARELPYVVARRSIGDTAAGWALEDTTGFCKVIADPRTRLLLGGHVMGPMAAILIQPLVQAMRFGQTVDELATMPMYPHPALTEVIEQALLEL
jgi:mycothione reductase